MAFIERIGINFGKKLILKGHQFTYKPLWQGNNTRLMDRPINYQTRCFRGRSRNGDSKSVDITPEVEVLKLQGSKFMTLTKPIVFTFAACTCSFAGAAIWQYENLLRNFRLSKNRSANLFKKRFGWNDKLGSWRNEVFLVICNTVCSGGFMGHVSGIATELNVRLSEGQKLSMGLIGANVLVFLLWRVPRLNPIMTKYFCSNPAARAVCWPMVLSTFSHCSGFHMLVNMFVLYSFADVSCKVLGYEQFLAMYLSAGVVSSLASYVYKVITVTPGLSLGASGCLMGVLGFFCVKYPDAQLSIVFLPMIPFSAALGLKAIVAMDTLGVVLGWKLFDHAAHLGGVGFGVSYALWGRKYITKKQETFLTWWDNFRGKPF